MVKFFRRLLIRLGIVVGLIILGLGYLGYMPGVSALFGSNHPLDLGATPTAADTLSANTKFHQQFVDVGRGMTPAEILAAATPNAVDQSFSGKEIAAYLMETHPVSDLQIVFHQDGSFEAAGKIDKKRISSLTKVLALTSIADLDVLNTIRRFIPGSPTFYLRGTGRVTNNQPQLKLAAAKIGRVPVANLAFSEGLLAYARTVLAHVPGMAIDQLTIAESQLHYQGSAPGRVPIY